MSDTYILSTGCISFQILNRLLFYFYKIPLQSSYFFAILNIYSTDVLSRQAILYSKKYRLSLKVMMVRDKPPEE